MIIKFKEKISIFSAAVLAAFMLVAFFLIVPLFESIAETNEQIYEKRITLEISKKRSENLASFQKDIEEIEKKLETLEAMFINESNQIAFFRDLESTAQANNLKLNYNLEDISKKTQSPKEVLITLNLEGQYNYLLKFIGRLESLDYYLKIKNLSFKPAAGENQQANLQAVSFWQ